ncbi:MULTISPECIES: ROK family transcriptional regulator [unclassified Rhizobium]|uniref:ROK family transcriptional regulator n=1 Tax=unclassified Rhizobium TaxID=2613769 RepID=UPI0006F78A07|nr:MULTISPECIES: ROK family transcriptional regulator [unclassified Rhizobium]KQV44571.1 ROK family transcriptional regulator [Rhizobium sp. Root1212]KRD38754.1 ROK family transcriptional regulator [Rhizobium sp. Root268]
MKAISGTNLEKAKAHNRRVVIEAIRTSGPLSRAEIARLTALTAQTVSNIVEELEGSELLKADSPQKLARGQPFTPYSINPDGAYSIGLELERDHAAGVLTDLSGTIRARIVRPIDPPTPERAIPILAAISAELQTAFPFERDRLLGAGIAMPGRYAAEGVTSLTPIALPGWQHYEVGPALEALLGMPVLVENDATAAAIGERLYGVARGLSSFVYLFLGGGIGAGLFLDGHLYRGSRANAGEIGHIVVEPDGLPCVCGKRGCLDRYVSLGAAYEYLKIDDPGAHSVEELDAIVETAGPALDGWLDAAAEAMRRTIDFLELAFDPQTIVLGGPMPAGLLRRLAALMEPLYPPVNPEEERRIARIMIAATGKDTSILGAAALPVFSETNPQFAVLQKSVS